MRPAGRGLIDYPRTSTNVEVKESAVSESTVIAAVPLTIGQVARRSGIAVSALHFYERSGLIASTRTDGNQRRYAREVLRRLALIRIAQRVGIPLAEIRSALDSLPEGRAPSPDDWRRLTSGWRDELSLRIHRLEQLRDRFTDCIGCGCLSIDRCSLANPGDILAAEGPGPRRLLDEQAGQGVSGEPRSAA